MDLLGELEKLAEVTDPRLRRRAEIRFVRKLESGRYPVLFSEELKEERTLMEIRDSSEMARTIVRLSEESQKVVGR
ncbi:MAG: hypothetical protein R2855_02885 [Thermomicrobiales bacterium]